MVTFLKTLNSLAPITVMVLFTLLSTAAMGEVPEAVRAAMNNDWTPIRISFHGENEDAAPFRFYRWKFGEEGHYRIDQIVHLAENMLDYQNKDGGWRKNTDMSHQHTPPPEKRFGKSTFDNLTTYTQIMYLARVRRVTGLKRYDEAIRMGIAYTIRSQNPRSGGWHGSDGDTITFNDGVMANVMAFMKEVARKDDLYGWLDPVLREKAERAYGKGLDCILTCQIKQGDTLTAWGQQHRHDSFETCGARGFEPPCITAAESVGVVRLLMNIETPSPEVIRAVDAAIAWFEKVQIDAVHVHVGNIEGRDKTVVRNPDDPVIKVLLKGVSADPANRVSGPPIWARMYDPATNDIILCDRGRKFVGSLAEMSHERRVGYGWHGTWPARLVGEDYPAWVKRVKQ